MRNLSRSSWSGVLGGSSSGLEGDAGSELGLDNAGSDDGKGDMGICKRSDDGVGGSARRGGVERGEGMDGDDGIWRIGDGDLVSSGGGGVDCDGGARMSGAGFAFGVPGALVGARGGVGVEGRVARLRGLKREVRRRRNPILG